jgi:hypothetical protein
VNVQLQVLDGKESEEETPPVTLWDVYRPWPKGRTSFIIGETVPGEQVRTPFGSLARYPIVYVRVLAKGVAGWDSDFDLRKVTTELSGGVNYSKPITQADLDRIGGCTR